MTTETPIQLLREHHFVQGMPAPQIEQLGALARLVRMAPEQLLFREGEHSADFFLILSGTVALEIAPPTGGVCRVETLSGGDETGWSSVIGQGMLFQARVLQDMQALAFDAARLRELCETDRAFGYEFMRRVLLLVGHRLHVTRLLVMDSYWPVAKLAGA